MVEADDGYEEYHDICNSEPLDEEPMNLIRPPTLPQCALLGIIWTKKAGNAALMQVAGLG